MQNTYAQKQKTAQKKDASTAAAVLDASSQSEGLQRKADMANGALQRVKKINGKDVLESGDPAYMKFKFQPSNNMDDFRVPYDAGGQIYFSPYINGELKSAGFSGCFMMAFKFTEKTASSNLTKYVPLNLDNSFVAHVPNKSRQALFQAEQLDFIDIKALIRPFRGQDYDADKVYSTKLSEGNQASKGAASIHALTGGLEQVTEDQWRGNVYYQEKIYSVNPNAPQNSGNTNNGDKFTWKTSPYRRLSTQEVADETLMCKAFIYATVANESGDLGINASEKLKKMAKENPIILDTAKKLFGNRSAPKGSEDYQAFSKLKSYLPFWYKVKKFFGCV